MTALVPTQSKKGITCPPSLPSLILGRSIWFWTGSTHDGLEVRSESKLNSLRSFWNKYLTPITKSSCLEKIIWFSIKFNFSGIPTELIA